MGAPRSLNDRCECGSVIEQAKTGPRRRRCETCDGAHKKARYLAYVSKPGVLAAKRARERAYYAKNKDRLTELKRAWCASNKDKTVQRSAAYRAANKDKLREASKRWRDQNRSLISEKRIAKMYGVSPSEMQRMRDEQGDACAICRAPGGSLGLCVDHDHATGAVRGLLCQTCNKGLGCFSDSVENISRAATYLLKHKPGVRLRSA
jgi:hypothetical protein